MIDARSDEEQGRVVGRIEPLPEPGAALDPLADPVRWERVVEAVVEAARPELLRRERAQTSVWIPSRWMRPVAAAAASVAVIAGSALVGAGVSATPAEAEVITIAEALAPSSVSAWLNAGDLPDVDEVLAALTENEP